MNDNKIIDQSQLAESVAEKIPYTFLDYFLVKPLDKPVKDDNGIEAVEGTPKTEVKEVESDYQQGVVIKIPHTYEKSIKDGHNVFDIKLGDIILYKTTRTIPFDLLKDSRLIRSFDITAVKNG